MSPGLVMIVAIGSIAFVLFIMMINRHKERMNMIERGVDASIFTSREKGGYPTLKFGMLFVGIALGILLGEFLHFRGLEKGIAYLSMVFLLGGVSLILNFIIESRLNRNE